MKLKVRLAILLFLTIIGVTSFMLPMSSQTLLSLQYKISGSIDTVIARSSPSSIRPSGLVVTTSSQEAIRNSDYVNASQQQRRQALIELICRENPQELHRRSGWVYKFDWKRKLLYCPIPKAGWSSWKRTFFYINGAIKSTDVEIGVSSDRLAGVGDVGEEQARELKQTYKFVFVRNPWDRLISAYNNKAIDYNYTRILRTPCAWEKMEPYGPPLSFTQFLTCIADSIQVPRQLAMQRVDMHWTPQWKLCDFCSINYNFIGHLETMDGDSRQVLKDNSIANALFPKIFSSSRKAAPVSSSLKKSWRPMNVGGRRGNTNETEAVMNGSSHGNRASDKLIKWYRDVPEDVLRKIQEMFHYDFLLHGYDSRIPGWDS